MTASLYADGQPIPLNPFVEIFLGNIARAVLASLKNTEGATRAVFLFRGNHMGIILNGRPLDLHIDRGFAEVMARDTLLGAMTHLKGLKGSQEIRLEVEL